MFSIFKKNIKYDLAWLGPDMHSHLLNGIDDGCPDSAISLQCISGLQELGYKQFFATPHVFDEVYPNTSESIRDAHKRLTEDLKADPNLSSVTLHAAAEYMLDDKFSSYYERGELLTLPGNHVLIEMSYQFERQDLFEQLFQLQLREYKPILAHPERYNFYHNTLKSYAKIRERGCKFQLNILSLAGYYGEKTRKVAQHLVNEGMIDFLGTDVHHLKHLNAIKQFASTTDLQKLLKGNRIQNAELFI